MSDPRTAPPRPVAEADIAAAKAFFLLTDLMRARLNAAAGERGITPQQGHLLHLTGEGASMRELADRLACDPSNVTGLADRLEEQGLIERRRDDTDRRVTLLVPTPRGRAMAEEMAAEIFDQLPIYRGLSADERVQLQALLAKVMDHRDNAIDASRVAPWNE